MTEPDGIQVEDFDPDKHAELLPPAGHHDQPEQSRKAPTFSGWVDDDA